MKAELKLAWRIVTREWDNQGECESCGWHASLSEYDMAEYDVYVNEKFQRIEMSCLSKNDDGSLHRGVCIYYENGEL